MLSKINLSILVVLALSLMLAACESKSAEQPTATTDPNAVYTAAAQTADARLTEIAQTTPSPTPETPTATPDAAQTVSAQTAEALLTQVAQLSETPASSPTTTTAPVVLAAERAEFVLDVTIPDGTDLEPGASFEKTWRLKNGGTSTWTTDYKLTFISGDQMGTLTSVSLPNAVAPGETVDISVDLVAPTAAGRYRGYWKMANSTGQLFESSIYVEIDVVGEGGTDATPTPSPTGGVVATPTPTATGSSGVVSNLSMAVDAPSYAGTCPHLLTFSATFTVNQDVTLDYELEAGSDTPGFEFNLPGAQTATFSAGTYTLSFPLEIGASVSGGWVRLHFTAPVDITSSKATFDLTCQQ
ncbi:MAG: hypothetical protein JW726_18145 [Anaerolineales bacterium]|nr:hypothetical protein [Anaerolineales bacterium]